MAVFQRLMHEENLFKLRDYPLTLDRDYTANII